MLNPATPFRAVLRERNIRLLLAGLTVSQAGDWLYNLALLAFVYDRTHSSAWVGLTTGARVVPLVLLGPLGGVLADRVHRRPLMITCDLVRAATMAGLAFVALTHGPVILAPVVAALCTAGAAPYLPSVQAVLPKLVSPDQLPAANAARVSLTHICLVAGPVFGALLLLIGSPAIVFAINAITFLVGATVVAALPRDALRLSAGPSGTRSRPGPISGLRAGWSALRDCDGAGLLVGANVIASTIYGAFTVLFVLLSHRLGLGSGGYGYLIAGGGAGGVLSAGLAHRAAASAHPRRALALAMTALGAPLPLLAFADSLPVAIGLAAVFGAGSIVAEVVADTSLQRSLDPAVLARAYGFVVPANIAGIAGGALLAPLFVAWFGFSGSLVGAGVAVIAYSALVGARSGGMKRRRIPRPAPGLLGLAGALVIAGSVFTAAAHAALPPNCTQIAHTVSCTFTYTGAEQAFTVPTGVRLLHVNAVGAPGASSDDATGGRGGTVNTALPATPGKSLYVEVGGAGSSGGAGGWNGGGAGGNGDGGGGASDLRTVSCAADCPGTTPSLISRLVVAGGGGGAGAGGLARTQPSPFGGAAGSAGGDSPNGGGGGPGTSEAGGAAGAPGVGLGMPSSTGYGEAGAFGRGGAGVGSPPDGQIGFGGGGGGGYYGGGGGGTNTAANSLDVVDGGGGGGGASYAPGGQIGIAPAGAAPSVTISYGLPAASISRQTLSFTSQPQTTLSATQPFTVTDVGDAPLQVTRLTLTGADAGDFVTSDDCRGGEIDPGNTCTVNVAFAPQALGSRSATLEVTSNDQSGPATIALTGTGEALPTGTQTPTGVQSSQGPPAGNAATVLSFLVFAGGGSSPNGLGKFATFHIARGGRVVASGKLTIRGGLVGVRLPGLRPGRYRLTVTVGTGKRQRRVLQRTFTIGPQ
jgi:predicted MFS family arabinose efflux permease